MIKVADVLSVLNADVCESKDWNSSDFGDENFIVFDHASEGARIILSIDFSEAASFPVTVSACGEGAPDYIEFMIAEEGKLAMQMTWQPGDVMTERIRGAVHDATDLLKGALMACMYDAAQEEHEASLAAR